MKSEVIVQKSHRFGYDHAVRNCGVAVVEVETARRARARRQREDRDDALLQRQQLRRSHPRRRVRAAREEARHPDAERLRGGRAAGREPLEVHRDGIRPRRVLGRQGHSRSAERRAAARAQGRSSTRRGSTDRRTRTSIGRGFKVNKEEMLGMLVAVELYLAARSRARAARVRGSVPRSIRKAATAVPGVKAEVFVPGGRQPRAARARRLGARDRESAAAVVQALETASRRLAPAPRTTLWSSACG